MPFRDFAGSTVVHSIGGAISLDRRDRARPAARPRVPRDGGGPPLPHNIILGAVGGLILWFGWYGFNPGSTLSALDVQGIGRVSFNTTMAACSAGLAALFYAYARVGKWDLGLTTNGFLAGLVGDHLPVLLGEPDRRVLHRPRRRRASSSGRPTRSSTCASTIRSAPCRCTWCAASGARCRSACSRRAPTGCRRRRAWTRRVVGEGTVLRRRHGAAHVAGDRQRRGRLRDARRSPSC